MDFKTFMVCTMVLLALVSQLESKPAEMHADCNKVQRGIRSARSTMDVAGGPDGGEAGGVVADGRDDGARNEEQ